MATHGVDIRAGPGPHGRQHSQKTVLMPKCRRRSFPVSHIKGEGETLQKNAVNTSGILNVSEGSVQKKVRHSL